jgi:rubrerythrin
MSLADEPMNMSELLEVAVATEEHGQAFYERLASRFAQAPKLSETFMTPARDEASHRDAFANLKARVLRMETTPTRQRAMELQARSLDAFFREGVEKKVDSVASVEDVLEMALQLEKSTLAFYESMQEAFGKEPTLQSLIRAEKRHVEVVMRTMVTGAELRSVDDDFTGKHPKGAAKQDARMRSATELSDVNPTQ